MRWGVLVVFVAVYLSGARWGYVKGEAGWRHFLYMWQHASLFHLLANWTSISAFYPALRPHFPRAFLWGSAYLCAVGASYLSAEPAPTVGASGMACAWVGMYIAEGLTGEIKIQSRWRYALWLTATLFSIAAGGLWSRVNVWNHVFALIAGMIATGVGRAGKWMFNKF